MGKLKQKLLCRNQPVYSNANASSNALPMLMTTPPYQKTTPIFCRSIKSLEIYLTINGTVYTLQEAEQYEVVRACFQQCVASTGKVIRHKDIQQYFHIIGLFCIIFLRILHETKILPVIFIRRKAFKQMIFIINKNCMVESGVPKIGSTNFNF